MDWSSCLDKGVPTVLCVNVLLSNLINGALIFAGAAAVILIIFAGARFVTSGGERKNIDSAKKTITYAIIGLIVILVSFGIINLIIAITGATCIGKGIGGCN